MSLKWRDVPSPRRPKSPLRRQYQPARPLVPASRRHQVFNVIHGLFHPSGKRRWPSCWQRGSSGMECRGCEDLGEAVPAVPNQQSGASHRVGIGEFPQPGRRFGHVHIDIVAFPIRWGQISPDGGQPLNKVARSHARARSHRQHVREALLYSWISRFGVPDHITTNRGPAFLSELWSALARLLGTAHHTTTAYNPAANSLVKRFHRSLKASLMARCTSEDWKYQLPWVLLGLRTGPRADGALSAAERTYGEPLVVLGKQVTEDRHNPSVQGLRDTVGKFAPCKRTYTDRSVTFTTPGLSSTTRIFIRDDTVRPPLTRPCRGPFHVLERNSKAFLLALHGKNDWVSVDCIKPALLKEDTYVTTPHPPPGQSSPQPAPLVRSRHGAALLKHLPKTAASHPTHTGCFPRCPHVALAPFSAPADTLTNQTLPTLFGGVFVKVSAERVFCGDVHFFASTIRHTWCG
ncbi:uncharacterized protein [Macrobrachium rosenbergii]|uniref:uncharacterized protein n=1 Tax=Macrobrachium rosenbergii TaxID=79674 RepID=UPI0034D4C757